MVAATLLLGSGVLWAVPASAAAPILPAHDPFYAYSGSRPLSAIAPGTVLKTRTVDVSLLGNTTPVTAHQLLFRTSGELGQPTVTVTTVIRPATAAVQPKIVSYQSFYDALGGQCDPSFTLAGGDPGSANQQNADAEEGLITQFLAAGYVVNVPDFEGEDLEWAAGQESGWDTLDSIKAAEADLAVPASTEVGLFGYSGGSIGSEWASELAPTYAPTLNLVGVAAGGIPVDFAHNLTYINGSASWADVMPAVFLSLTKAFNIDLGKYLSPYGRNLVAKAQGQCINSLPATPGLTYQKLLKPQYQDIFAVPEIAEMINHLIMGSTPGHPAGPLLMGVGNADGTGDGVMIAADVEALAHEYCSQGVGIEFVAFDKLPHTEAAVPFDALAIAFLEQRFAGVPFVGNCATVTAGNSLAPLVVHRPTANPAQNATPATSGVRRSGTPAGGLAATGLDARLPLVALVALLMALVVSRNRSRQSQPGG